GQGVVAESLNLCNLEGYRVGGTFHVICNNQIGFTTSNPRDLRSTPNCSDVAKFLEAPVLHVNADDPEAVIIATRVALDYRMAFNKDVVLDLVCYRRLGHNEADEPAATQPVMYQTIRNHPTARAQYAERLIADGVIDAKTPDAMLDAYRRDLEAGKPIPEANLGLIGNTFTADWGPYLDGNLSDDVPTEIDTATVAAMAEAITRVPDTVKIHNRVARIVADRKRMAAGEAPMDWGFAESMAYASILNDGFGVRLTGQDAGRGTFFHRHAVLHEQDQAAQHIPLQHIAPGQPSFRVTDSFLSEEAVLGFEYGFATTEPDSLIIWEAQFGDFANGAQVVIDQFISSGESKWGLLCGLTLLLPHGYEGQGPEHSSARLERFLQLCAENNIQVCVPSTPSQMFHMLRRQIKRNVRKPLVVMTPKSLLRHKLSVSPIEELSTGRFHHVIDDSDAPDPAGVTRLVFCSGKVYFDLLQGRRERELDSVAIVRIEQLYPFPVSEYADVLERYGAVEDVVWCQEEPENQGAWYQIRHRLQAPLGTERQVRYAGREGAAAPAAGYYQVHVQQQQALVESALGVAPAEG
ncbi:MAG: 2-oxoglutarate dehydrogenase E1 component, partial [Pseudomonadota bacterium]